MEIRNLQKEIYQNKIDKGFNTTNIEYDFCLLYGEVNEAYEAYLKRKPDLDEELADIFIYVAGLAEMLGVDLEDAIVKKVNINKNRKYKRVNGVPIRVEGIV